MPVYYYWIVSGGMLLVEVNYEWLEGVAEGVVLGVAGVA